MTSELSKFLAEAVIAGIISSIIAPLIANRIIDRYRHNNTKEIETLKSTNRQLEKRLETRESWLYLDRARVTSDIYARVIDVENALLSLSPSNLKQNDKATIARHF